MASINVTIQDRGLSQDRGETLQAEFFALQDVGLSKDWSVLGQTKPIGPIVDTGLGVTTFAVHLLLGASIADIGIGVDTANMVPEPKPVAFLTIVDVGASLDQAFASYNALMVIVDVGRGIDLGDFAPAIPVLREALPDETAGVVNFARNPSLEYESVGTRDWSAETGITFTRDDALEAWTGIQYGHAVIAAGAGTPRVIVVSQALLSIEGYGRNWVASVSIAGDAPAVELSLALVYTDATTDVSGIVIVDPSTDTPLVDVSPRYSTEVIAQDPLKLLSRLDLRIGVPQDAVDAYDLRIDGAQFEEAITGGATPYADGDMGIGHYWTGAPGYSMSVREPGS